ncbi:methyl-accepting chemotaxis protein [Marinobacter sp. S6332]|uniref:methyl-accepting chemotaxis protein n=1 Tax=Marinobacter sp. S6332 TaxID=2926403 RepID=UPI001FF3A333|nr:methyl-accepting chemotaxis protein [Marinobacter sp. S6332]MCK0162447.1 methyl-accepting chemotaxis protein [Marinobacter sp. S6332]
MKFMNSLRIRTRLLLAVLIPVLATAATVSWISINQIQAGGAAELKRLELSLMESRKQGLKNLVDAAKTIVDEARNNPGLTELQAKKTAADRLRAIQFEKNNYVFAFSRSGQAISYSPNPSIEGKKAGPTFLSVLSQLYKALESDGYYAYDWSNPASGNEEHKISYAAEVPEWDWLIAAGVYVTDIERQVDSARVEIEASIARTIWSGILVTLAVVVVSLLIGVFVGRTVTRPLRNVSDIMQEIADGDGDLRQRLPDEGADELAELGRRFNAFVIKIQTTIKEVGSTTDQVASAAEELSRVALETRSSVQQQGAETDQIASAINEMAATIQQIAGNANEVEGAASDADRMARDGGETIANAQVAVTKLSEEIQESAQNINALAEKSDDIQQVLDVIHAVTEQTNLLALNAAIEAARAGDHGRGFSVVADEVRQLARRSAESADQIREMIDGFVSESLSAVERMNRSQSHSTETVERINHATGALTTIENSIGQIHDQVTQIATAAEQQSQVAEEINQNVVRIVEAAQRSDAGVSQTNEASSELARLGERLRGLVSQFKV